MDVKNDVKEFEEAIYVMTFYISWKKRKEEIYTNVGNSDGGQQKVGDFKPD